MRTEVHLLSLQTSHLWRCFVRPSIFNNRGFNGEIDEASVYNRALTTNEVPALFNAGSAGKCQPCVRMTPGVARHDTGGKKF